ncbi:MAG: hypothetical protein ACFCU7_14900 [Pleurocapsa sp.]
MSQTINFADLQFETPTIEQVTAKYAQINAALDRAATITDKKSSFATVGRFTPSLR